MIVYAELLSRHSDSVSLIQGDLKTGHEDVQKRLMELQGRYSPSRGWLQTDQGCIFT